MSQISKLGKKRKAGLTLVEIIIVTAIFSIMIVALLTVFRSGIDSWRKSETLLDMYQNARFAFDLMEREISRAYLYQDSNNSDYWTKFLGTTSGSRIKTSSAADEIFFVAPVADNPGKQDLCEIGYWIKDDGSQKCLMRHFEYFDGSVVPVVYNFTKKADGSSDTGAGDPVIARNVTDLQFVYYYRHSAGASPATDSPALHTWNSTADNPGSRAENYDSGGNAKHPDGLPDAVSVTMTVCSSDGKQTKTFTDFIRILGAK